MTLVNQLAEADVKSREGMLAHSATIGVVDGTNSELPACRLRRVTQYMQENLQRELRLSELGALVHMSPFHFARLFRQSTGMPPHRFLVRCRIDEARALLAARTAPIAEISRLVGFRTPSHFTTTFRRITGTTPSAYRSSGAGAVHQPGDRG
jgi:AraC family transcriptional regulator